MRRDGDLEAAATSGIERDVRDGGGGRPLRRRRRRPPQPPRRAPRAAQVKQVGGAVLRTRADVPAGLENVSLRFLINI